MVFKEVIVLLNSIFSLVLTQSITGGFLTLLLIALKPLTSKRFSAVWQYYVWIFAIIWLLIPLVPNISVFDNNIVPIKQTDIFSPEVISREDRLPTPINNDISSLILTTAGMQIKILIPWVWCIGVVVFGSYTGCKYIQFNLKLKRSSFLVTNPSITSELNACRSNLGIRKIISLNCSSSIGTPILSGFFNPVITLPDVDFRSEEYKLIFTHELIHYKRKDIWYKMITLIANIIHWFNPLAYIVMKNIDEACEYACDEVVTRDMNDYERKYYGETILNLIALQLERKMVMSTALCGIKKFERRLSMIIKSNKSNKSIMVLAVVIILVLAAGVITSGFAGNMLGVRKSGNNSDILNKRETNEMQKMYDFHIELDNTMANAFEVDLNNYRKIDTLPGFVKSEHKELHIGDIREQLHLKYGNTSPSIYLNKDNTQGIALTQDLQGVYILYEFEINKDEDSRFKWTIKATKTIQGEYKAANKNVEEYFKKNPNPKDNILPPLQPPTSKYETIKPQNQKD